MPREFVTFKCTECGEETYFGDKKSAIANEQQAKEAEVLAEEKELDKVEEELTKEEEAKKEALKREPK